MAKSAESTAPDSRVRTILVTGDVVVDHHIYLGEQRSWTEIDCRKRQTFEYVELGGAAMIERLLRLPPGDKQPDWEVHFGPVKSHAKYAHCFATWSPYPAPGPKVKEPSYWLANEAGYGLTGSISREDDERVPAGQECPERAPDPTGAVHVLVVDDAGAGFRDCRESWPDCLAGKAEAPAWMVWKMAGNLRGGALWDQVKSMPDLHSHLILVVSSADLRRSGMDVAVGLSWERSALDVVKELKATKLEPLQAAAHVIVSFPDAGVLWLNRLGEGERKEGMAPEPVARLIFAPSGSEGTRIATHRPKSFGYQACLAAGIVWDVASAPSGSEPDLGRGLRRGLLARRKLHVEGHGGLQETMCPAGFPATAIQVEALAPVPAADHEPKFADMRIPNGAPDNWTIAQQGMMAPGPFYDIAYAVVRDGLDALSSVPKLALGGYTTIERGEIEAIRRLQRRVHDYVSEPTQKCPLSIAVFGAPGAGKSFIVEEMAKGFLGDDVPFLEFNLSQISDERDLHGAFHLLQSAILKGITPVVFWDEFDSQEYRWLRLLLAPMQDGKFRERQTIHPIGKCIFVFAGGTSATFADFGKPEDGLAAAQVARQDRAWRMVKGPDFKSRIHGYLDVLGPNPRLLKDAASRPVVDKSDASFPIRRALFLRGVWKLGRKGPDREFDEQLARALLEVPEYTNGSRSFQRVLAHLAQGDTRIGPETLPSVEDLERDIASPEDARRFVKSAHGEDRVGVMQEQLRLGIEDRIDELAARINQVYMTNPAAMRNADVTFAYDNLSLFLRESNRAAVRRIPRVLKVAGLEIVKRDTKGALTLVEALKFVEKEINPAASEEHRAWCEFHLERGWKPTIAQIDRKDPISDPPRHPLLVSWEALAKEEDREKDRKQVRHYVEIIYDFYRHAADSDKKPEMEFALARIS